MATLLGQDGTSFSTPYATDVFNSSGNAAYFSAGYTGVVGNATAFVINVGALGTSNFVKGCVYSGGALQLVTNPITLSGTGLLSVPITFATAAQNYVLVAIPDTGNFNVVSNSGSGNFVDHQNIAANFSYASPPATLPAADVTVGQEFVIYLSGTTGVVDTLLGQGWV